MKQRDEPQSRILPFSPDSVCVGLGLQCSAGPEGCRRIEFSGLPELCSCEEEVCGVLFGLDGVL